MPADAFERAKFATGSHVLIAFAILNREERVLERSATKVAVFDLSVRLK
jgi:hypothetical protein